MRPGSTALDRLATPAPALTGGILPVAAPAHGAPHTTTAAFVVAGPPALAGGMLQNRR